MWLHMSVMDHLEYICQSSAFSQIVLLYLKNKSKRHRCDFGWAFSYFLPFSNQRTEEPRLFHVVFSSSACSGGGGQNCQPEQSCLKMSAFLPSLQSPRSVSFFVFCLIDFCCTAHRGGSSIHEYTSCGGTAKSSRRGGNEGCQKTVARFAWIISPLLGYVYPPAAQRRSRRRFELIHRWT